MGAVYAIMPKTVAPFPVPSRVRLFVHAVFDARDPPEPSVTVAAISFSVPQRFPGTIPVVPHIVAELPPVARDETLHVELGIPRGARVFCRHGGANTFSIAAARRALCSLAREDAKNVVVLLLSTDAAACERGLSNIIHVPRTTDMTRKARFLATCNACIHGRSDGETFGLAVAECSQAGLPVFTYAHPPSDAAHHLTVLGGEARLYEGKLDLLAALRSFDVKEARARAHVYASLFDRFHAADVMLRFLEAFNVLDAVAEGAVLPPKIIF